MRNNRGFSLVEAMVVIGIAGLILAFGIPAFSKWKGNHDSEDQINTIFNDLQQARTRAYTEKRVSGLWWSAGSTFDTYELRLDGDVNADNQDGDILDNTDVKLSPASRPTRFTITRSGSAVNYITFDGRGFCSINGVVTTAPIFLRINSTTGPSIDCIAVNCTRIQVGKWNGGTCQPR